RMTLAPAPGETVRSLVARAAHAVGVDPGELLGGRLMFAVNRERVDPDHPVAPGDEVALLPPLSGGL
ncbi:MAG: MoaD/ThiS family protein, partial [Nitrospinae bacterium]|nr:MoaD/ThiS family protein [Nitrospinota bacterium]